jgi:Asp-tRNA(Asn)/Glu-tRNA(Gln) amidotransferase A subunit family amidase
MATAWPTPFSSATAMLEALRNRQISSVELLDLHLRQITQQNPALNAIVTPDFDRARPTAEEADACQGWTYRRAYARSGRRHHGEDQPIHICR